MFVALNVLTPPANEPVTVDLARRHIRVDHTDDDDLIAMYVSTARRLAENYLGRILVTQQLRWSISETPPGNNWSLTGAPVILPQWLPISLMSRAPLRLPRSPVQSIDRVAVSSAGAVSDTVLDVTSYSYDLTGAPPRLLIAPGFMPNPGQHVLVDFTAGVTDLSTIPANIIHAILFGAAWLYEHRGDEGDAMGAAFENLLTPYRLVTFG